MALALLVMGGSADAATIGVKVRWGASTGAVGYRVYWRPLSVLAPSSFDVGAPAAAADGSLSYVVPGVDSAVDNAFSVSAYRGRGIESTRSSELVLAAAAASGSCTAPTVVPSGGGVFNGVTSGADGLGGSCGGAAGAPERVFAWTPTASGTATIETCSARQTTFDTVLYLRQGACAAGTEVACNDDTQGCGTTRDPSSPSHGSRLTPTVTAGQTYYIVVDGYGGQRGSFALTITPPASAPSATCPGATVIPSTGGVFTGATSGASAITGTCSRTDKAPERVFQWTPSVSGTATIHTCSATKTTFDTVLYLREGTCGGSTDLACNDDTPGCGDTDDTANPYHGSKITPSVTAGKTYFIVVDGYGTKSGNFQLTVTPPASAARASIAVAVSTPASVEAPATVCRSAADCAPPNACTEMRCRGGRCVGTPLTCGNGRPCEEATCDPTSGCALRASADGGACHGVDPCRTDECQGGACVPPENGPARDEAGHQLAVQHFALRTRGRAPQLAATGWFAPSTAVDPAVTGATLEVSAPDGRILYRADVDATRFVSDRRRRAFRYAAPRTGVADDPADGLVRLVLRRSGARVRVAAAVTSDALAAVGREPTVRWTLRLGETCVRELALDCTLDGGTDVRCASASAPY